MRSTLKAIMLATLLAQGGMAYAQDAESDAAPAADALPLGEPVGPQIGQPYVLEEFGDWQIRCIKAAEGQQEQCSLYQLLVNETGLAVAEFNLRVLPEGAQAVAGATVVVPLETLLTEQLTMGVDGTSARRYPFRFCNAAGCVAQFGITAEEINQLKFGIVGNLRLVPAAEPEANVVLEISLTGFTAGYEALAAR